MVAFAKPFRMPDFFLISGLFLSRVIDRDWRTYLDRKVVHFVYFYVLWVTIQFAFKAPGLRAEHGWPASPALYLEAFMEPFGTLWFIYLLPVFFVVTKLHARRIPQIVVWLVAAALEIVPIETGWTMIDEFAARFVYFYTGYILARALLRDRREHVQARPAAAWPACRSGACSTRSGLLRLRRAAVRVARRWACSARRPWWRSRRCWPRSTCSSRCAIAAATRSSSIWRSSCRWR